MAICKRIVLCGSPRPGSKTLRAAATLERSLFGDAPGLETVDLSAGATATDHLPELIGQAEVVVAASPVYKGAMTGMLKSAFDELRGGALEGRVCIAMMLGAGPGHGLAARYSLAPVLEELGGFVLPSLYVTEAELAEGEGWAIRYKKRLEAVGGSAMARLLAPHAA